MQITAPYANTYQASNIPQAAREANLAASKAKDGDSEVRKRFDEFVGQTFFSQLISQMRKTVDKPAYFDGGRAEEIFQGQLDQMLTEKMTQASGDRFSGPMFERFMGR
jgi:flagellar protein FlgJ